MEGKKKKIQKTVREEAEGPGMKRCKMVYSLTSQTLGSHVQWNGSFKVTEIPHDFGQTTLWMDEVLVSMKCLN